jgi:hypothetical protein
MKYSKKNQKFTKLEHQVPHGVCKKRKKNRIKGTKKTIHINLNSRVRKKKTKKK